VAKSPTPGAAPPAPHPEQARQKAREKARLAEALKANLKRRKVQARGRSTETESDRNPGSTGTDPAD
jgi:hypothetical protein